MFTATYSPEDNKLRLYASARLDKDLYDRVRAAGFIWAPKQELFVAPKWTPEREDFLVELCGDIDEEDTTLEERAAARAERFEGYSDKRGAEAEGARAHVEQIAKRFEFGQPILVGHHSEKGARRDREKIEHGMRKAIKLRDTSTYWERRAEGVQRHADYKANPRVRANRIKTLEAEQRSHQRDLDRATKGIALWTKVAAETDPAVQLAAALIAAQDRFSAFGTWDELKAGRLTPADAAARAIAGRERIIARANRWIAHLLNRLAYERVLLGRAPDEVTKVDRTRRGDAALPLLNYRVETIALRCKWRKGETETYRVVDMTAAEYQKIDGDYRGTRVSVDGTHRYRIAIGRGHTYSAVFITDSKAHPVPVPKAPEPEQAAEIDVEETNEEPEESVELLYDPDPEPCLVEPAPEREPEPPAPVDPFEAMRASLKAGIKAVVVPELFVSPPAVAERVVDEADVRQGDLVLEPSAGLGALALVARALGATVVCVEQAPACANALRALEFTVEQGDFLEVGDTLAGMTGARGSFDAVIMNPPFSADIEHVRHAYGFLKPGGRLSAVMSGGTEYRTGKRTAEFRAFVKALGGEIEKLPDGSFEESGTGTGTVLVTLRRPAAVVQELAPVVPAAKPSKPARDDSPEAKARRSEAARKANVTRKAAKAAPLAAPVADPPTA